MSVDAVTYRRAESLTRAYGFVVNVGETITGKEFSDRILWFRQSIVSGSLRVKSNMPATLSQVRDIITNAVKRCGGRVDFREQKVAFILEV